MGSLNLFQMEFLYLFFVSAGLLHPQVSGRVVNISSTWFLPQEGFPVFYRYFNDKVTWTEAEGICSSHRATLLSVQSSRRMDAAQAYLKELDVTDNIWIGLLRESSHKPFVWTNNEELIGEGFWNEPFPKTSEKLCAAIDPAADFRWNSFICAGPQVASFVCELPVPEWAKAEDGCLITSLPSLTVTLIPESGVIQLLSDCGLNGTRRIACKGGENREEIIKRLSCDSDVLSSTTLSSSTTTGSIREINTPQTIWSEASNQNNGDESAQTYFFQTRHRRNVNLTINTPIQGETTSSPKNNKVTSKAFINVASHSFPHSPYLASVRNAPSTASPQTVQSNSQKMSEQISTIAQNAKKDRPSQSNDSSSEGSLPLYKDLPVLIITGDKLNESFPSATSESPQIVLMIENKDLDEPFLVPLSDDIIINNPSLSPAGVLDVDLVEVDNLTASTAINQTNPTIPSATSAIAHPLRLVRANKSRARSVTTMKLETESPTEESLNAAEKEDKKADVSLRYNRGRLLTRSNRPFYYPRILNRMLG